MLDVFFFVFFFQDDDFFLSFMVVGMPNVGKSSLINALRRNYLKKGAYMMYTMLRPE